MQSGNEKLLALLIRDYEEAKGIIANVDM